MSLTYGLNGTPARAKTPKPISIKLIGVGGAGCNAVDRLLEFGLEGVEYLAANTDAQALRRCHAPHKILLGRRTTRGMGTGGNARMGTQAARESYPELTEALLGADLVFLAGGMGGGTGSGAIPVVAELVRSLDSLALAIVTTPFGWEGHPRQRVATAGILQLQRFCDTLVVVPNDKLLQFATPTLSLDVALRAADDVLRQAVQGLTELVSRPGVIQVDFSAVQALLRKPGGALLTVGHGKGENKVADALHMALQHPLHDAAALDQATGLLAHFSGGADLSLHEINDAISKLRAAAHPRTEMVWGTSTDEQMSGRAQVILMATGVGGIRCRMYCTKPSGPFSTAACRTSPRPQKSTHRYPTWPIWRTTNSMCQCMPPHGRQRGRLTPAPSPAHKCRTIWKRQRTCGAPCTPAKQQIIFSSSVAETT